MVGGCFGGFVWRPGIRLGIAWNRLVRIRDCRGWRG